MPNLEQQTRRFRIALEWLKERADSPETVEKAPSVANSKEWSEGKMRRRDTVDDAETRRPTAPFEKTSGPTRESVRE